MPQMASTSRSCGTCQRHVSGINPRPLDANVCGFPCFSVPPVAGAETETAWAPPFEGVLPAKGNAAVRVTVPKKRVTVPLPGNDLSRRGRERRFYARCAGLGHRPGVA